MPIPVTVCLVGAGPGDPGLITVAGAEALQRADVVVYDYLANARLLDMAPPHAERIYVGKSANQHTLSQDEINQLLVDKANALSNADRFLLGGAPADATRERIIVRLKGGDPYVFGRGGEEAQFLLNHHVAFRVIPGITSGIAGPAYAGIPVTHREFASTITLVTGHEKDAASLPAPQPGGATLEVTAMPGVNYEALAKLGGTLVFYMGVKSLPEISKRLIAAGMAASTPTAVVQWGTRPNQRTISGSLENIAEIADGAGITAPAITVIGSVVSLRHRLNWFEQRPLFGKRVVVTRSRQQASELARGLNELGADVLEAPTIELALPEDWTATDQALGEMSRQDWIVFTSANGVRAAWQRLLELRLDARAFPNRVAAIGPATAHALAEIGIITDLIPEKFVGEELAAALKQNMGTVQGKRVLLLRADIARPLLRDVLRSAGAQVEDVAIYQTAKPKGLPEEVVAALRKGQVDYITFTSASTAMNFQELLPTDLLPVIPNIQKVSIGPVTSEALRALGWKPELEATSHDIPGVIACILAHTMEK